MPLSATERMGCYRAKLKESNDQYEAIKENDRQRKAKKNLRWQNHSSRNIELLIKKLWKSIEQIEKDKITTSTAIKAFKTPQSLGKAKNRVKKHLPQSPRHKKGLIINTIINGWRIWHKS